MALQSKNRLIIHMLRTEAKTRANKNFRLWRWLQKCEVFSYRAYPVGSNNCFVPFVFVFEGIRENQGAGLLLHCICSLCLPHISHNPKLEIWHFYWQFIVGSQLDDSTAPCYLVNTIAYFNVYFMSELKHKWFRFLEKQKEKSLLQGIL